jgi:hypothetical protein
MHPYGYQICLLLNVAEFQIDVKDLQELFREKKLTKAVIKNKKSM